MIDIPHELLEIDKKIASSLPAEEHLIIEFDGENERGNDSLRIRDAIAAELIEHAAKIPSGVTVYSCSYDSANSPQAWLEVRLEGGAVLIWDQTRHGNSGFLELDAALKIWDGYGKPEQKMQIIPEPQEKLFSAEEEKEKD